MLTSRIDSPISSMDSGNPIRKRSERRSEVGDYRSVIRDQRSLQREAYVLVTPIYNEEAYITQTIASVLSQTILPAEWVIVSDRPTAQMGS
ncbi:MAG: hypothetical protein CMK36_07980 [Porticoccaceae bacterium]|nr:hypothetical protein [Porticoccaceae bacterium]